MRRLFLSTQQDVGYALRQLRASPGFTFSAVACLAIGVWLACITTAVGRGVYRPDLGVPRADRLVQVEEAGLFALGTHEANACCGRSISRSVFDWIERERVLSAVGHYGTYGFSFADESVVRGAMVLSSGMFSVLGIRPHLGRGFLPEEDRRGAGNVVLLSYQFWQRRFGGDSAILGRSLWLKRASGGRKELKVVGVMPRDFTFVSTDIRIDIYVAAGGSIGWTWTRPVLFMVGRLRDGSSVREVEDRVRDVALRNVAADRREFSDQWLSRMGSAATVPTGPVRVRAMRFYDAPLSDSGHRTMLLIIGCAVAVVLIACANVANLLLVRGAARRREVAVRMALGASRSRIIAQLMAESALLSIAGSIIGFVAAYGHWRLLDSTFVLRRLLGKIDGNVALTAAILSVALVALFGLMPAFRTSSMRLEQVLRDARRAGMGATRLDGLLSRLVIASTAATVVLLSSAMLLGMSARELAERQERGLTMQNVLALDLSFDEALKPRETVARAAAALARLSALPGVRSAAIAPIPVGAQLSTVTATPEGRAAVNLNTTEVRSITGGYFATLGVPMIAGRTFTAREAEDSSGVVIVGVAVAKQVWPGESAVGKRVQLQFGRGAALVANVVGIAPDIGDSEGGRSQIYRPFGAAPIRQTAALVRFTRASDVRPAPAMRALRSAGGIDVTDGGLLADRLRGPTALNRYLSRGFALFAGAGLVLVVIGLYGVISFSVASRTHEIGVRMALGAERSAVEWMVTSQGLRMTFIGTVIGLLLSAASARMLDSQLRDVEAFDPRVLIGIILLTITVTGIASYIPGRRAGKLDPMDALRAE